MAKSATGTEYVNAQLIDLKEFIDECAKLIRQDGWNLSNLTKWDSNLPAGFSVTYINGVSHVSGTMTLPSYERLWIPVKVGKNSSLQLTFRMSNVSMPAGHNKGDGVYMNVLKSAPPSGYIRGDYSGLIDRTEATSSGSHEMRFNSGDAETIYIVLDWADVKNNQPFSASYSKIYLKRV